MVIDNGSTCSILNHRIYLKLLDTTKDKIILQPSSCKLFEFNGNPLQLHGCFRQTLTLGEGSYELDFLVCKIYQDAILGQDFLLEHIDKIDYRKQILSTKHSDIQCWVGGEAEMVCRVLSRQTVIIPGKSRAIISVNLENGEHLAKLGLVDHVTKLNDQEIIMTRGVLEPHKPAIQVQMTNFMDEPVAIYINEQIGTCESYY
jgi:hypothetical protein